MTLYRVVKLHLDEFIRYLRWILIARDEFARFKSENPESLTDIQRAVRFYYLLKNGYSSRIVKPTFSVSTTKPSSFNLLRVEEDLSAAHLRLARVFIENMHYEKLLERFDRPHTFFYLDPPYYACEDYYGKNIFSRDDFSRLSALLKGIKGKFILSINDVKEIRDIFRGFNLEEVSTSYSTPGAHKRKHVSELLISNY